MLAHACTNVALTWQASLKAHLGQLNQVNLLGRVLTHALVLEAVDQSLLEDGELWV